MTKHALILAASLAVIGTGAAAQDWSGGYAGLQVGGSDIDTSIGAPGDGRSVGVFAGYNFQSGGVVYGFEIATRGTRARKSARALFRISASVGVNAVFICFL